MRPYQTIVEFLLAGAIRIHPSERVDMVCSVFAGMLAEMVPHEIVELRWQVQAYSEIIPELTESIVDLIDGHIALREILSDAVDEPSKSAEWPGREG
jgi:hypothetical protein